MSSLVHNDEITSSQLSSLSSHTHLTNSKPIGRGNGGRGLSRRSNLSSLEINSLSVSLNYDSTPLLLNASVQFLPDRIYALIGHNGLGKSTLLKSLHNKTILGMSKNLSTYYVPQSIQVEDDQTVKDWILDNDKRLEMLELELENADDDDIEGICSEMSIIEEQMNDERTLTSALSNFEVEKLINSKMSKLSEGQKKRVSLACASIYSADVLLLDEPTNHLDSPSINLLIKSLSNLPSTSTTILISHNRHLIDSTCTHVCEIRELNLHYYPGNFSDYVKIKNSNIAGQISSQEKVNNERKRLIKSMDNMNVGDVKKEKQIKSRQKKIERTGVSKNSKGHKFKSQNDGIRLGSINSTLKADVRNSTNLVSQLKKVQNVLMPVIPKAIRFEFKSPINLGTCDWLFKLNNLSYGYEKPAREMVFTELEVRCNETHVILGSNAVGKSNLLKILADKNDNGMTIKGEIERDFNAVIGFYSEDEIKVFLDNVEEEESVLNFMCRINNMKEFDMRGELSSFGFIGDRVFQKVKFLSGGEKVRLVLSNINLKKPDILILDEPSNHLDTESVHALASGLKDFKGSIVVASHDYYFLRILEPHKVWRIKEVEREEVKRVLGVERVVALEEGGLETYFNDL
ncbi:hypothetical protein TrLO_g14790 [Triparma laevis f. longispina]|uniref:ABC transporter domain-containing protein n=1 Tax=Triparma laevis f. longispina TaxID=1714387 RepID=A0A9W7DRW5_9STRA|nr:hypothetical protein TrLO_g14790 [Triparma laevis f. longispina]